MSAYDDGRDYSPVGDRESKLWDALELIAAWRERIGPLDDDCATLGQIARAALDGDPLPPDDEIETWAWRRSRPDLYRQRRIEEIRKLLGRWPACACLGPGPESVPGECNCQTQIRKLREELAGLLRPVVPPGDDQQEDVA